jgi:uridine kinase
MANPYVLTIGIAGGTGAGKVRVVGDPSSEARNIKQPTNASHIALWYHDTYCYCTRLFRRHLLVT